LTVNSINDSKAVIVFAGRDITGGRPGNNLSDYFEGENSSLNSIYDTDETEDYVRVISP
jgi:hypothetical protein